MSSLANPPLPPNRLGASLEVSSSTADGQQAVGQGLEGEPRIVTGSPVIRSRKAESRAAAVPAESVTAGSGGELSHGPGGRPLSWFPLIC